MELRSQSLPQTQPASLTDLDLKSFMPPIHVPKVSDSQRGALDPDTDSMIYICHKILNGDGGPVA